MKKKKKKRNNNPAFLGRHLGSCQGGGDSGKRWMREWALTVSRSSSSHSLVCSSLVIDSRSGPCLWALLNQNVNQRL